MTVTCGNLVQQDACVLLRRQQRGSDVNAARDQIGEFAAESCCQAHTVDETGSTLSVSFNAWL